MKYRVGDKFEIPLKIVDIDVDNMYMLEDEREVEICVWISGEELQRLTDPNYAERKRQQEIAELEKRLEELKGG